MESFTSTTEFCPSCGSIFPILGKTDEITCYSCKKVFPTDVLEGRIIDYTINFNSYDPEILNNKQKTKEEPNDEIDGPIVDRICPKCGCNKMSYATLQLRSADEGQTVFFTCTKCKFKELENS